MTNIGISRVFDAASRRLLGASSLADVAVERQVVCPAEEFYVAPTVFLPGQIDNITALHPDTTRAAEEFRVKGGAVRHQATEAFMMKNARFDGAVLHKGRWAQHFARSESVEPAQNTRPEGGAFALASSSAGGRYFGHWLRDDTSTYLLAEQFGAPLCVPTPNWSDKKFYAEVFQQDWRASMRHRFETLYIFNDVGQNSHKIARYKLLRERMAAKVPQRFEGHRVYLRRGDTGAVRRNFINEAAVVEALEKEGFHILDIARNSIEEISSVLRGAKVFVTIEGSQQEHAFSTIDASASFLAIIPPNMFNNLPLDWTSGLGMKYGFVVGEADGAGFNVNPANLLKTIDLLTQ